MSCGKIMYKLIPTYLSGPIYGGLYDVMRLSGYRAGRDLSEAVRRCLFVILARAGGGPRKSSSVGRSGQRGERWCSRRVLEVECSGRRGAGVLGL